MSFKTRRFSCISLLLCVLLVLELSLTPFCLSLGGGTAIAADEVTVTETTYGVGLKAEYFNGEDLTDPAFVRIDETIDHTNGEFNDPRLTEDSFRVRWTGKIVPLFSETYDIEVETHGGVRLWIDGQLLIDEWEKNGNVNESASLALTAGESVELRMEYGEEKGLAEAFLRWSSESQPRQIIPKSSLFPPFIPGAPEHVSGTAQSDAVEIVWDAVEGAEGYEVEADGAIVAATTSTEYVHEGLLPNTTHTYRVRATIPEIAGAWSNAIVVRTKVGVPANVQAATEPGKILLTWDAVAGAAGYEVEADGDVIDVGMTAAYTHEGLLAGTTHAYRVRAYGADEAGDWSAVVSRTVDSDVPENVTATRTTDTIRLAWDVVTGAISYEVEADGSVSDVGADAEFTHEGLLPNTSHTYRVRAVFEDGARAWSLPVTATTLPMSGQGTGVKAEYYPNDDLTGERSERIEETIDTERSEQHDFDSVRWTGQVEPYFTETYTFIAVAHGGVRLWIDGELILTVEGESGPQTHESLPVALTAGARYDIQMEYRNKGGAARAKLYWESASQERTTIPTSQLYPIGVPIGLSAERGETTIELQWQPVAYAQSYDVEADGAVIASAAGDAYVHENLIPGTAHTYRVRAVNGAAVGEWSAAFTTTTTLAVPVVESLLPTETSIEVQWSSVPGATGYDIEVDGAFTNNDALTTYLHNGLLSGTVHRYRVRAKTEAVIGAWSAPVDKWTLPDVPQGIQAASDSSSITLSWEAVRGATDYEIEAYSTILGNGSLTTYVDDELPSNAQRTYRVRAVNDSGPGKWSGVVAKTTRPAAPASVTGSATDRSVLVAWDAVAGAVRYEIEADGATVEVEGTSYAHSGLESNSEHTYRVRAFNAEGPGAWSGLVTVMTLPSKPYGIVATAGSDHVAVLWNPVSGATSYDVEADGVVYNTALQTTFTHSGLTPNTEHAYRVRARNAGVVGEWSAVVGAVTLLGAPANVTAMPSDGRVTLSWEPVVGAVRYEVEADGNATDNGLHTTFAHEGLPANSSHAYRVRAVGAGGPGEWSDALHAKTPVGRPTLTAAATASTSITLNWDEVAGAVGYDIIADGVTLDNGLATSYVHEGLLPYSWHVYRVRARGVDSVGGWSEAANVSTMLAAPVVTKIVKTSRSVTLYWTIVPGATLYEVEADGSLVQSSAKTGFFHDNLQPNSKHTYRVRAKNDSASGEWSDWSSLFTASTAPNVPSGLTGTPTTSAVELAWEPVAGAETYDLDVDGGIVSGLKSTGYVHEELTPNEMHRYRVRSVGAGGPSPWSEHISVRTTPELTVSVGKDTAFNFVMVAPKKTGQSQRRIVVTYDPAQLDVLDLSAVSPAAETTTGPIAGTNMTVTEFTPGRIVYVVTSADKTIVNSVRFLAKTNEHSKITYTVE